MHTVYRVEFEFIIYFLLTFTGSLTANIVYKHWPDTSEFIIQTVELWNRWIRLSCFYNRV